MKYVPTVTGNLIKKFNINDYAEILYTPNNILLSIPEDYKGKIIVDNGGFLINALNKDKNRLYDHIDRCIELINDSRCTFVLPDVIKDHEFTKNITEYFFEMLRDVKIAIPEMYLEYPQEVEKKFKIKAEFYCCYGRSTQISDHKNKYHVLGRPRVYDKDFRSYDSHTEVF